MANPRTTPGFPADAALASRRPTLRPTVAELGLIEDAHRRRNRRLRIQAAGAAGVIVAAAFVATMTGPGQRAPRQASGHAALPGGINLIVPPSWHIYPPPDTALSYPLDRALITSYATHTGGNCSPTTAEAALPRGGVLIYLLEYGGNASSALGHPPKMSFPALASGVRLPAHATPFECWTVPSYMVRFSLGSRLFQAHIALGIGAGLAARAQAAKVLDSLRVSS